MISILHAKADIFVVFISALLFILLEQSTQTLLTASLMGRAIANPGSLYAAECRKLIADSHF